MFKTLPLAGAVALALGGALAHGADVAPPTPAASSPAVQPIAPIRLERVEVTGQRQRLDEARNALSPDTGSTIYRFDKTDIDRLPLGDATPLNEVLLRAPGVVGDSYGQLHVRGDHANLQYRINGVVIPESISGFGQTLGTRFADQISVLTGALPAQFGYRTAGVVDIRTKGADLANAGSVDLVLGSHGHTEISADVGGTSGDFQYYVSGSWLQNNIGIENPTALRDALHDHTTQTKGFAYLSYLLGDSSRVSLMLAASHNRFEIPNVPGQVPDFTLSGVTPPDSRHLDARQAERSTFQVLSFQSTFGNGVDYQVALFNRYSNLHYQPDPVGDLVFNGVAADITRKNTASGLQLDMSRQLNPEHTLRWGLYYQRERASTANTSTVFPADADGHQTSDVPLTIVDNGQLGGHLLGLYLQDEWQPTKALTVNYGLRYDRVTTVAAESQVSPRLGLVYQLGQDTRLHAGYASYFTPPPTEKIDSTSVDKFLGTTNALPSDANTAVRAERSQYFDLGVSHQLTPRITIGADAYYRSVKHLQDEGQFGNALIYSAFNFEQGRIYGLDLTSSYKDEQLSAYANVSLLTARGKGIETGQFNFDPDELATIQNNWVHLDHEQQLSASAGVSYRFAERTTLGLDALYGSGLRRGFANTEHLPSFTHFNAYVSRSFQADDFGRLDLRLSVINLLDRSYQLRDGSGIGVGAPQYGPRRTVYLSLSRPFTF